MPVLPVITNTFRVTLDWTNTALGAPATVHNVLHFIGDTGDVTDLATSLNGLLNTNSANCFKALSTSYEITSITVLPLDGTSGGTGVSVSGAAGANAGDYIAQGCCVLSLYTGARGPQGRGRLYLGPVAEAVQQDGHVAVTAADVTGAWQNVIDGMSGLGADMAVASYAHAVSRPVVSLAMHSPLFTQRRRALRG